MKPIAFAATGLAALAFSLSAFAQSSPQSYVTVNAGIAFPPDQDLEGLFLDDAEVEAAFATETEFNSSFFGSVVLGRSFAPANRSGFGLEVEGFYHALNPEGFSFGGIDLDPNVDDAEEFFAGNASAFGGLANVVYHVRNDSPIGLRVGGGLGYARVSYDIDSAFDEGDGGLVYQAFAGVDYALTDRMGLNLTGRYMGLSDTEIRNDEFRVDAQLDSLIATVGLTWRY